jgi:predicted ferric reductase
MTILNQKDYDRFTWKHRKVLLIYALIIIAIRVTTEYIGLKIEIILNGIITVMAVAGFLFLAEILILQNYKKSIEEMQKNL